MARQTNADSTAAHSPDKKPDQGSLLSEAELEQLVRSLKVDKKGRLDLAELVKMMDATVDSKNVANGSNSSPVLPTSQAQSRRAYLCRMLGLKEDDQYISVKDFKQRVRGWRVPSLKAEKEDGAKKAERPPLSRRLRAWWKVMGVEIVFMTIFVFIQAALGVQHTLMYALDEDIMHAFGWGVPTAKFCAGALYPTLIMLLLTMSRWLGTLFRASKLLTRGMSTDHAKALHIILAVEVVVLSTIHAVSHLSGTFYHGQQLHSQWFVNVKLHSFHRWTYDNFLTTIPGVTGLIALPLLYIMSALSMPIVRKKSYEHFQMAHLLMFPFIGLLMVHGTSHMLQYPLLGILLAIPTLLVLMERLTRLVRGFRSISAKIVIVDKETVNVRCEIPSSRLWPYHAGQYAFLQVPALSRFQWHPFTVSLCTQREIHFHIKTDGNWTKKLRDLAQGGEGVETDIKVGIDGPYGAPAQRFYSFDQAIIIGAGIGITPFSAILNDLQVRESSRWNGTEGVYLRAQKHLSFKRATLRSRAEDGDAQPPYTPYDSLQQREAKERLASQLSNRSGTFHQQAPYSAVSQWSSSRSSASSLTAQTPSPYPPWSILSKKKVVRGSENTTLPLFHDNVHRWGTAHIDAGQMQLSLGQDQKVDLNRYRRVDMHWIVRDRSHLSWFTDLINAISCHSESHSQPYLDVRIHNHVTRTQDTVTTYLFRWLAEQYRVVSTLAKSPLTGMVAPTHFGRPNFQKIMGDHYDEMLDLFQAHPDRKRRVGVFYCGNPAVGAQLADICHLLTLRGTQDGSHIKYFFQMEVFS